MGAWSADAFGNDSACDWGAALVRGEDLRPIYQAFGAVISISAEDYLDSDVASRGIAACEVVARLYGQCGVQNPYTAEIDTWVEQHKDLATPRLIGLADQVIDHVLGENSELSKLWGNDEEWEAAMWDLRSRLDEIDVQ